jgi:hypothetical protein
MRFNIMVYGLSTEEKYTATIDRISRNGNGIIRIGMNGHLNLGPMPKSKEGKVVTFIYEGEKNAVISQMGEEEEATSISDLTFDTGTSSSSGQTNSRSNYSNSSGHMNGRSNRSKRSKSVDNPMKDEAGSRNNLLNGN